MAPVHGVARARPLLAWTVATAIALLAPLVLGACTQDGSVDIAATASATAPGSAPGTIPGPAPATAPPATAPSSTTVPSTTVPPTAPTTSVAARGGAVVRGLSTTTSTQAFIDTSRPTISNGRTVAGTRTLTTTVVRPSGGGPYPLVVFAHGYQLGPSSYQHLIEVIASAGYVVAAPSFPLADATVAGPNLDRGDIPNQSGDLSFVIDQLLTGPLAGPIDRSRVGAVGHSDGADTVLDLGYHPQRLDTRVRAVAALSPDAMVGGAVGGAPLLVVHGDRDRIVPYANATTVFSQVPSHRVLVTLVGADHLPPVQGAAPWAKVVESSILDLLDARVAGRVEGDGALLADASVAGVATVKEAG